MKRNLLILATLILFVFFLNSCGVTQKGTGGDNGSGSPSGGGLNKNLVSIANQVIQNGTGLIKVNKIIIFGFPSGHTCDFQITGPSFLPEHTSLPPVQTGGVITVDIQGGPAVGSDLMWILKHASGAHSMGVWEFKMPSPTQDLVFDVLAIVPELDWHEDYYYDASEGILTTNAAVNWDLKLVTCNRDTSYDLGIIATGNSRVYLEGSVIQADYIVDDNKFSLVATKNQVSSLYPEIVFKTQEGNYGYIRGSRLADGVLPHMSFYYYEDGSDQFYKPEEKVPSYMLE